MPPVPQQEPTTVPNGPARAAVILAAGKSTRMKSKLPKPLHPVCGLPMTSHVIEACRQAGFARCIVVVGHEGEAVRVELGRVNGETRVNGVNEETRVNGVNTETG